MENLEEVAIRVAAKYGVKGAGFEGFGRLIDPDHLAALCHRHTGE